MEEKYKLNILKDILKFSSKKLTDEEFNNLMFSPLFKSRNYFTSAALLVKSSSITIDELLILTTISLEELSLYLIPVEDNFDYFKEVTPKEIAKAFELMDNYLINNKQQSLKNLESNHEKITRIKKLYLNSLDSFRRRA